MAGLSEGKRSSASAWWIARLLLVSLSPCLLVSLCEAHPIPKDNHDLTVVVRLARAAVLVDYRLEVDEGRAARDLDSETLGTIQSPEQLYPVFMQAMKGWLSKNLDARLDGRPLSFFCV